jgi:hypothetical protein
VWSRDQRNDHLETAPPGDPSHIQPPNPDTIVDANKSLLTAWYSCLLRGFASAWQIQKWMLTTIHLTEHRVSNEGARESIQGDEGVYSSMGRKQHELTSTPRAPWDWTTNKIVHMIGLMAPAAYGAEDVLVGHQWKDRPLVLWRLYAIV